MFTDNKIWIASNENRLYLLPQMANRHGIISGATGTGKTITLKVLAESFSEAGVPVFVSDVKGDLSGMGAPGEDSENMQKRIERFGLADKNFNYQGDRDGDGPASHFPDLRAQRDPGGRHEHRVPRRRR